MSTNGWFIRKVENGGYRAVCKTNGSEIVTGASFPTVDEARVYIAVNFDMGRKMLEKERYTTNYPSKGEPYFPKNFTGELEVWGTDLVPDRFDVVNGKIVKTLYRARGDWTKVG